MYNFPEEHMRDERNYGIVVFDFYFHYRKNYTYIYVHILSRKIYIYIYNVHKRYHRNIFLWIIYYVLCNSQTKRKRKIAGKIMVYVRIMMGVVN